MGSVLKFIVAGFTVVAFIGAAYADGDPENGRKVFKKCRICHRIGPNAKHGIGPILNNIFGAKAGSREGYRYSKQMTEAGENGLDWDEDTLSEFLINPKTFFPGHRHIVPPYKGNNMDHLIAYLKTL